MKNTAIPTAMWTAGIRLGGKNASTLARTTSLAAFAETATTHAAAIAAGMRTKAFPTGSANARKSATIAKKSVAEHALVISSVTPPAVKARGENMSGTPQ